MTLLEEIRRYLRNTGMAPTTFGSLTVGDKRLVPEIRAGRHPRPARVQYLRDWMAAHPNGVAEKTRRLRDVAKASAAIAAATKAEAASAGERRRRAKSTGSVAKPIDRAPATPAERISTLLVEEPGDLIAHVRRRWPELWGGVLASARAAKVPPGAQLMTVIEAGLAAVGGTGR